MKGPGRISQDSRIFVLVTNAAGWLLFFLYSFVQKLNMKENSRISIIWSMGFNLFLRILKSRNWVKIIFSYFINILFLSLFPVFMLYSDVFNTMQSQYNAIHTCCQQLLAALSSLIREKNYHSSQFWHPIALGKICEFNYILEATHLFMIANDRKKDVFIILMCVRASAGWPLASLCHPLRTLENKIKSMSFLSKTSWFWTIRNVISSQQNKRIHCTWQPICIHTGCSSHIFLIWLL